MRHPPALVSTNEQVMLGDKASDNELTEYLEIALETWSIPCQGQQAYRKSVYKVTAVAKQCKFKTSDANLTVRRFRNITVDLDCRTFFLPGNLHVSIGMAH